MKAIYNSLVFPALGLLLAGCSDFLKQTGQDQYIPKTTADYKELLYGEAGFYYLTEITSALSGSTPWRGYTFVMYMTDDVEYFNAVTDRPEGNGYATPATSWVERSGTYLDLLQGAFTWQPDVEMNLFVNENYLLLYHHVLMANVCLQNVDQSEGTTEEKDILKGQASFTRAFAYFMLANLYAKPYNKAQPTDLCVPLKTDVAPAVAPPARATMAQVWGVIADDIETALLTLEGKKINENKHHINHQAALILATRIYLYMENWAKVIECGEKFRTMYGNKYPIYNITDKAFYDGEVFHPTSSLENRTTPPFNRTDNSEIVWVMGNNGSASPGSSPYTSFLQPAGTLIGASATTLTLRASSLNPKGIIAQYRDGDHRLSYWFYKPAKNLTPLAPPYLYNYTPGKIQRASSKFLGSVYTCHSMFRTSEVTLMLAEAYARKSTPDKTKAVAMLDELRSKRIDAAHYTTEKWTDGTFTTPQALVDSIFQERRRELCFEELHRWWDLRRMNNTSRPDIVHRWKGKVKYTLGANDDAGYILDFPVKEIEISGATLVPNTRPARPSQPES